MKKLLLLFVLLISLNAKGQYVTIPDNYFVAFLQQNYPSCMNGNQMDTTCSAIINASILNCSGRGIYNLNGIQYFINLSQLNCSSNNFDSLPLLPNSIQILDCHGTWLTELSNLPSGLTDLNCSVNHYLSNITALPNSIINLNCADNILTNLPALPNTLQQLTCNNNSLTNLPSLPNSLLNLNCSHNNLTSLPSLPGSLQTLDCSYNSNLLNLPTLPNTIQTLSCWACNLTSLPTLPNSILHINCSLNPLGLLPTLPISLQDINCSFDQLASIPVIPNSVTYLDCSNNQLTSFPTLSNSLLTLKCPGNYFINLPALPNSITSLDCSSNPVMTSLSALPTSLTYLKCTSSKLTLLPSLPYNLHELFCEYNPITNLPILPAGLEKLYCAGDSLTSLPVLSPSLTILNCDGNMLSSLPALPNSLTSLECSYNQLTSLPIIPTSVLGISCSYNLLTDLPPLHDQIYTLLCDHNQINCFPYFPQSLDNPGSFNISFNSFTCLPNYLSAMTPSNLSHPLCVAGDFINNPFACSGASGIVGTTYLDTIANCNRDTNENGFLNVPISLYDSVSTLLTKSYSMYNGIFYFPDSLGTYIVEVDTTDKPYNIYCSPGNDTTVTNNSSNPLAENINFAISCKPGYDVGVKSITHSSFVFPGQAHLLEILAGDLSQWYNLNCASGIGGQIEINVTGPIHYVGIPVGSATPIVSGSMFTYNIADFGNTNLQLAYGLYFTVDTTAQAGDYIYVNVNITPTNGDNNPSNNSYTYYYQVSNSLDPNYKSVYPTNVSPLYNDWFTYTIHFQNTGNAAAHNIRLLDTLSNNLDLNTFEVINYSHYNKVYLNGNILTVTYPNIMLPDSLSDPVGSQGFVQYRIKSKPGMQLGTQIKNTAYIYFDYNSPVITNTAVSEFTTTSIKNINASQLQVYPNPTTGKLTVKIKDNKASINLYNQLGERLIQMNNVSQQSEIDLGNFPAGMYYLQLRTGGGVETVKMVKE